MVQIELDNRQLTDQKIRRLFSNNQTGYIATLVNAPILATIQWSRVNHYHTLIWLALLIAIALARMILVRRFSRLKDDTGPIDCWKNFLVLGIFASGLIWGLAGIILFPHSSNTHQLFTVFIIGGMVAGSSAIYATFRSAFLAFAIPAMLPVIINSLTYQDKIHLGMSVTSALFLVLMIATCFRNNKAVVDSIKLGFENQDLLNFLLEEKKRTELYNHQLQDEVVERRRIEKQLEEHQKQLESIVEKRTAELQSRNKDLQLEITERKRIETALRDSEERYRLLIENAIVGIVVIQNSRIVFANSCISALSGYTVEGIIGATFDEFVHPDDLEMVKTNYQNRLSGKQLSNSYPLRLLDRKKEVHWLEVNAVRISYESKPAVLSFMRDITRQRKLEAQLFQNEKMASIGQLAAGVAHEINNPVGFVDSNLHTLGNYQKDLQKLVASFRELLIDLKTPMFQERLEENILCKLEKIDQIATEIELDFLLEDCPNLIEECQEGTERIKRIVCDLKDFIHPGKDEMQLTNINECLESTLNIIWNELKYNAEVIRKFGQIPDLEGHPQQLSQVFMNLLVNAGQAMDKKGEITIETHSENGHVVINISDTGGGIPEENLAKIFDPFFTTKPVGKGTGLGLNVSYNIIQKHQGTISATSKVNEGTTFTIHLPIHTTSPSEASGAVKNAEAIDAPHQ